MASRKPLSKKTRFEVFKRDRFTCQYCGEKAPAVVLEVDHVEAVANGGTDEILNLLTSCRDCNSGKSATPVDDLTVSKFALAQDMLRERTGKPSLNVLDTMDYYRSEGVEPDFMVYISSRVPDAMTFGAALFMRMIAVRTAAKHAQG